MLTTIQICKFSKTCRSEKSRSSKYHLGLVVGEADGNALKNWDKPN
jgi:hypothetical protein